MNTTRVASFDFDDVLHPTTRATRAYLERLTHDRELAKDPSIRPYELIGLRDPDEILRFFEEVEDHFKREGVLLDQEVLDLALWLKEHQFTIPPVTARPPAEDPYPDLVLATQAPGVFERVHYLGNSNPLIPIAKGAYTYNLGSMLHIDDDPPTCVGCADHGVLTFLRPTRANYAFRASLGHKGDRPNLIITPNIAALAYEVRSHVTVTLAMLRQG